MLYQLLAVARNQELRAVRAETPASNYPAIRLLRKIAFELAGLDTHRHSNHDLVKEQVTLLWYAALD
jgi:ribosomal protein S18 acetylase RimI-like enzyme